MASRSERREAAGQRLWGLWRGKLLIRAYAVESMARKEFLSGRYDRITPVTLLSGGGDG